MKKDVECEIVQDLLLGYSDGILNNESKKMVENHLRECDKCKIILKEIQDDIKNIKSENKEIDFLKNIKRKINSKNILIVIGSILIITIILFNLFVFFNYYKKISKIEIFLDTEITDESKKDLENKIKGYGDNIEIEFHSSKEHLENMKMNLGENSNLLNGYTESNNIFPSSYVVIAKPSIVKKIQQDIVLMDGVKTITSYMDTNPYELFVGEIMEKIISK